MTTHHPFTITFRGVRGTMPAAAPAFMGYGGNTSCVEVRCSQRLLILDAGTGIHSLGNQMDTKQADLLLSHTHIDHIIGLTTFAPLFQKDFTLRIWAGHLLPQSTIKDAIGRLISPPLFPLSLTDLSAGITWNDFTAGESLPGFGDISVSTIALNHPDRATGYRIAYGGHSLCYLTDLEHTAGTLDEDLSAFVHNTDLLIYDATYDDRQFAQYNGWGHSTWQQAVRLANHADVKMLALFHHDHLAEDALLKKRETELTAMRKEAFIAKEGLTFSF